MKPIEFNEIFRKLVNDARIEDIPIMHIIRIFAVVRDLIEEREY